MPRPPRISAAKRNAQIESISVLNITERMGPLALHMYAESFLNSAKSLPRPTVPFDPVIPYLLCHALELALKAFLSLRGTPMLQLAEGIYGHNLDAILSKAEELDLGGTVALTSAQRDAIRLASTYYMGKVFEYPAVGEAISAYPHMPPMDTLSDAAAILIQSLSQPCREAK